MLSKVPRSVARHASGKFYALSCATCLPRGRDRLASLIANRLHSNKYVICYKLRLSLPGLPSNFCSIKIVTAPPPSFSPFVARFPPSLSLSCVHQQPRQIVHRRSSNLCVFKIIIFKSRWRFEISIKKLLRPRKRAGFDR